MKNKSMDQTIEFLKALYGGTEFEVEFRPLPPEASRVFTRDFSQVDTIWKSCEEKQVGLCFGVATREGNDGTKIGCREVPALWVDIDFKGGTSRKVAQQRLRKFPLAPSALVVECQQVVHRKHESGEGRTVAESGVRAMPVVVVQPG